MWFTTTEAFLGEKAGAPASRLPRGGINPYNPLVLQLSFSSALSRWGAAAVSDLSLRASGSVPTTNPHRMEEAQAV